MTETSSCYIPIADFNERCQYIRKHKDFLLGDCVLYKDKILKRTMLGKERIIKTENQLRTQIQCCELIAKLNECPNIAEFYCYTYKKSLHDGETTVTLLEMRQFVESDLEREILAKIRDKDVFCEEDMWTIANQLISALAQLQEYNITHSHLCPRAISLSKGEKIQAKLNWTDFHQSTFAQVKAGTIPLNAKAFLSPEQLEAIKRKNPKTNYSSTISDVFALGMTIIYLCTLGDIEGIYNFKDMTIDLAQLKSKLSWVRGIYSERIYFLLSKMLKIDASKRSDFKCLEDLMSMVTKSGDLPEEPSSPLSKSLGNSSPASRFRNTSVGRRTITSAFESQKSQSPTFKRLPSSVSQATSPLSARTTSALNKSLSKSPMKVSSPLSAELLSARTTATITSIFDRKASPLKKEGFVPNDVLLEELEQKFLYDPLTKLLKNGMGTKHYSDGARYEGHSKGKLREKIGINYYANGDAYAGEWKNDKFHGRGVYFFASGERYEGQFTNGMKNGQAAFYYENRSKYIGEWKDNKKHGKGTFHYFDTKDKYEGDWAEGMRQGEGTFSFAKGDQYVGGWVRDQKEGYGVLNYNTGAKYEGEWAYNKPHGQGSMLYANGDKYEGSWAYGAKSGEGVYYYVDGSKYEGEWENDDKNGQGILQYSKGEKYVGEWQEGLKHGQGTYYYKDGSVYEGMWESDLKCGEGNIVLPDGSTYEGEWLAGERCGKGTLRLANKDEYEGDFKNDMMHGTGIYHWRNGDIYQGEWVKNKMHGTGRLTKRSGEDFRGIWDSQKLVRAIVTAE